MRIGKFGNAAEHKINMQKSIGFLKNKSWQQSQLMLFKENKKGNTQE